ncbi:unnamed protein product [Choristocarpus tenellus]
MAVVDPYLDLMVSAQPHSPGGSVLKTTLYGLEDGKVEVLGDLVVLRAGPRTYHPLKALKGMHSQDDLILISCLPKAPPPEATSLVRSALQQVLIRSSRSLKLVGEGVATSSMPHLHSMCPSTHDRLVDTRLIRAIPLARAREILAGLTPPDKEQLPNLPAVVIAVYGWGNLCYIGHQTADMGYSTFTVRPADMSELVHPGGGEGQARGVDDLIQDFSGGGSGEVCATARALYDLWGSSDDDVVGGSVSEVEDAAAGDNPLFARLAVEWDCLRSGNTRVLGSPPPPACSSLLLIAGTCPLTPASLALRTDLEMLTSMEQDATAAAAAASTTIVHAEKPSTSPSGMSATEHLVEHHERKQPWRLSHPQWQADLEALLSGSEHLADLAAPKGVVNNEGGDDRVQNRTSGLGVQGGENETLGEETGGEGGDGVQGPRRDDLDFSELLWDLLAVAPSPEDDARAALAAAFKALGEGRIFPVMSRGNNTTIGRHFRDGIAIAREARYPMRTSTIAHSGERFGGAQAGTASAREWAECGASMLRSQPKVAMACLELGIHKVQRDLAHRFEIETGLSADELARALPIEPDLALELVEDAKPQDLDTAAKAAAAAVARLGVLADTLDLVALAQTCGAPWRQARALAHSGLGYFGHCWKEYWYGSKGKERSGSITNNSRSSSPPVFALGLEDSLPSRARSKLAHPLFWELVLETQEGGRRGETGTWGRQHRGQQRGGGEGQLPEESVSYVMMRTGSFEPKDLARPLLLPASTVMAANGVLSGCDPELLPEVLSCVLGVESFAGLKRQQQMLRAGGANRERGDGMGTFICTHRYNPW